MSKKYNYIYITTNLINGKQYVGKHSTNNINDTYKGAGYLISKKLKEYGRENFKREILEFFEPNDNFLIIEEKYINQYNTLVPNGYNINKRGGNTEHFYDETSNKISSLHRGKKKSELHKKHLSEAKKGKPTWNKGKINIYSEETKRKMTEQKIGKPAWNKNKKLSDLHKKHLSESHKGINNFLNMIIGKCNYCGAEMKMSHLNRYHNENCKYK